MSRAAPLASRSSRRLLIACYFPRSLALEGVGTLVHATAEGMHRFGWQVELLWPGFQRTLRSGIEVQLYRPGKGGLGRYLAKLGRVSHNADAVVLLENNPNMGWVTRWSRTAGPTYCYFCTPLQRATAFGEMGYTRQGLMHAVIKHRLLARTQSWRNRQTLVASRFQAEQLYELGAKEVHLLPGGGLSSAVSLPSRCQARQALGWDERPVVGYLGHYSPAKGVPTLLGAFEQCQSSAVLALAHSGSGCLDGDAEQRLVRLARGNRVRQYGVVHPTQFLAACDLVVLPFSTSSIQHPPLVLVESFAAATPVLSVDIGGVSDLIRPGETGQLVPPGNVDAMTVAIDQILANRDEREAMGQRARWYFEDHLCTEVFCRRLNGILIDQDARDRTRTAA